MDYDVAIIGGGLSGLSLSIELRRMGFSVILFEKNSFPFHKVCGEYISNESLDYLQYLGIDPYELGAQQINRFELTTSKGSILRTSLPLGGFGISRYTLDHSLMRKAEEIGVIVQDGTSITSIDGHELKSRQATFTAKVVVGAQGKRSAIDKQLNRPFISSPLPSSENFIGVKYHVKADLPKDLIGLHLFEHGYCGISAIEGNAYCMCYLSKASNLGTSGSLQDLETNFMSKNPFLKRYLKDFPKLNPEPLVISQINFQNKEKGRAMTFFSGDAAGLIAPLSGNGMSMAMRSAHLLAQELPALINDKQTYEETLNRYAAQWQRAFGSRFRFARLIQGAFFNPLAMETLIKVCHYFPPMAGIIIRQTHGKPFSMDKPPNG